MLSVLGARLTSDRRTTSATRADPAGVRDMDKVNRLCASRLSSMTFEARSDTPYRQLAEYRERWLAVEGRHPIPQPPQMLPPWLEEGVEDTLLRAAAFETGAVEGLYESKSGATHLVAEAREGWEELLENDGAKRTFEDQYSAYRMALDYARDPAYPFGPALLGEIHATACANQTTLENGRPFRHGQIKITDNYVIDRFGRKRWYCPSQLVASELEQAFRLYEELKANQQPPVVLSAFLHWAITHIHPYEDGNGRAARIVASVPMLDAERIPIMVFADRKLTYLQALDHADNNQPSYIVQYTQERLEDMRAWAGDLLTLRSTGGNQDEIRMEIERILAAQEATGEPLVEIVARVRDAVLAEISVRLDWVSEAGGQLRVVGTFPQVRPEEPIPSDSRELRISLSAPLPLEIIDVHTFAMSDREDRNVSCYTGRIGELHHGLALRYADCTPNLSNEALLHIATYAEKEAIRIATVLKNEIVNTSRARGTLPPDSSDAPNIPSL